MTSQLSHLELYEHALEAVCVVNKKNLQIEYLNAQAEELFGATRERIIGHSLETWLIAPEDVFFWEEIRAGNHGVLSSESIFQRQDGSLRTVLRRVVELPNDALHFYVYFQDLTEQRHSERELEYLIAELRATLDSAADAIMVTDSFGAIRGFNQKLTEYFAVPNHLLERRNDAAILEWMQGRLSLRSAEKKYWLEPSMHAAVEKKDSLELVDDRVLECLSLPQFARGEVIGRIYTFRDVTQERIHQRKLLVAEKVFNHAPEGIFVADAGFVVRQSNDAFKRLIHEEPDNRLLLDNIFVAEEARDALLYWRNHMSDLDFWHGELNIRSTEGNATPCLLSLRKLRAAEGQTSYVGFVQDMTDVAAARQRIDELAYRDGLTGLANRITLTERFSFLIGQCERSAQHFAVLFIDVDRFKTINDSLGHSFGDHLLKGVAERLLSCVRQVDMVARLGGDEFVVVLSDTHQRGAEISANRILAALRKPMEVCDMTVNVSLSIGVALYPEDGDTADELIKNADSAMYAVKERGRDDFRFYRKEMNLGLLARVKMDSAIRLALDREEFELHFQPLVCLKSKRIQGAEALLRWQHKELGAVSPAQFIPVAEASGAIIPLGKWVLKKACETAKKWHESGCAVPVSVNVSGLQFQQSAFVESVVAALAEAGLPASLLELELTESILINDAEDAANKISQLRQLGVSVAIDDFGTGYSSFLYLQKYKVQKIKIDRSFVKHVPTRTTDTAIVSAIVSMARALQATIVAEGVETEEQRLFLAEKDCQLMQGYLFSPAIPEPSLLDMLKAQARLL